MARAARRCLWRLLWRNAARVRNGLNAPSLVHSTPFAYFDCKRRYAGIVIRATVYRVELQYCSSRGVRAPLRSARGSAARDLLNGDLSCLTLRCASSVSWGVAQKTAGY